MYPGFLEVWRQKKKGGYQALVPLIPRCVFVRCYLEMFTHLELIMMPGVIRLVEDAEGKPLVVPAEEILLLQKLVSAANAKQNITLELVPYTMVGEEVQVSEGVLQGVEGFFKEFGTFIVTIRSLKISIAVGPQLSIKVKPALV